MTDQSLRDECAAMGLVPPLSICRDLLGFTRGRVPNPLAPGRAQPRVSLRQHLGRDDPVLDLTLILAGSELITSTDEAVIDHAVWRVRKIYATAGIAVRFVHRRPILIADAREHDSVTSSAEIDDTSHDLTIDGDSVPVVLPAAMNVSTINADGTVSVTLGRSPIGGRCGQRHEDGKNSAVVMITGEETARTLAHEIGHFLGCKHPDDAGTNLMAQTGVAAAANGGDAFDAVAISDDDRVRMHGHCAVQSDSEHAADTVDYDPTDFTVEELLAATRGESTRLAGTLAVALLQAKMGDTAPATLAQVALNDAADLRARRAAVLAMGAIGSAFPVLREIAETAPDLVAHAARQVMSRSEQEKP